MHKISVFLYFLARQQTKQTPKLTVVSYLPVVQGKGTLASKIYQGLQERNQDNYEC